MYAPVNMLEFQFQFVAHIDVTDAAETGPSVSPSSAELLFDWQALETSPPFCICRGDEATCFTKSCSTFSQACLGYCSRGAASTPTLTQRLWTERCHGS